MHRHERMVHGGGKRQIARGEPMAGGQKRLARLEVETLHADVAALRRRLFDLHLIAVAFGVLLNNDRVAAGGHHAAGENSRRLVRADRVRKRPAGGDLADDFKPHRNARDVG